MRPKNPSSNDKTPAAEGLLFPLPERVPEDIKLPRLRHPVWTEHKANLIARYLYYFVLITKHGTYIDGFAGPQRPENPERSEGGRSKSQRVTSIPKSANFFEADRSNKPKLPFASSIKSRFSATGRLLFC